MMAGPKNIPTDLSVEIAGENVTPDKFLRVVQNFFNILKEITHAHAEQGEEVAWSVLVREGSGIIGVEPKDMAAKALIYTSVRKDFHIGFDALQHGRQTPSSFSIPAIKAAKNLANIAGVGDEDDTRIRVWVDKRPTEINHHTVASAVDVLKVGYEDYGSVEGRMSLIRDASGKLQGEIHDIVSGQNIKCKFEEDQLPMIFKAFRKRVEIFGMIKYRSDGTPKSVDMDKLTIFPERSKLPGFSEVLGIIRD
jgi:hypothetical protein